MSKDKKDESPLDGMFAAADTGRAGAALLAGIRNELVEQGVGGDIADQILLEILRTQIVTLQKETATLNLRAAELSIGRPF